MSNQSSGGYARTSRAVGQNQNRRALPQDELPVRIEARPPKARNNTWSRCAAPGTNGTS